MNVYFICTGFVYLVSDTFDDDPSVLNKTKSHDDDIVGNEGVVGQIINSEKNNFVRFD